MFKQPTWGVRMYDSHTSLLEVTGVQRAIHAVTPAAHIRKQAGLLHLSAPDPSRLRS